MEMRKLANLTLHSQKQYLDDFRKHGFEVESEPHGVLIKEASPQEIRNIARKSIDDAIKRGNEAVLLGGRTDVTIYQYLYAYEKGIPCYIVHTERKRKIIGGKEFFEFNFKGLTEILPDGVHLLPYLKFFINEVFDKVEDVKNYLYNICEKCPNLSSKYAYGSKCEQCLIRFLFPQT